MTITVATAEMPRHVATTVFEYVPGFVPAVKTPVLALIDPPPAATDQTTIPGLGVTFAPVKSVPVAPNCTVAPAATVAGFGATTSVERTPGSVLSLHAVAIEPATASASATRAMRVAGFSRCTIRTFMTLIIYFPLS